VRRVLAALAVSLAVHVALAAALAAYLRHAAGPDALASLDLSSVELSFSETVDESTLADMSVPPEDTNPAPTPKPPAPEAPPIREAAVDPGEPRYPDPTPPPETRVTFATRAAPAARQARIDAQPRPEKRIKPEYPKGARLRGEQGDVVLELEIGETGEVSSVSVAESCGFEELDAAAVRAVKTARFTPAKSGGAPVSSVARLKLEFRLR